MRDRPRLPKRTNGPSGFPVWNLISGDLALAEKVVESELAKSLIREAGFWGIGAAWSGQPIPSKLPELGVVIPRFSETRAPKVRGHISPGHRPGFWEPARFLRAAGPIYALRHVAIAILRPHSSRLQHQRPCATA